MLKRTLVVLTMVLSMIYLNVDNQVVNAVENRHKSDRNWEWPVMGMMTDEFGTRGGSHFGIDIAAEKGTPVKSVENGTVRKSYYSTTYGHVIFVQHSSGIETVYAHLNKRNVRERDKVQKGDIIGTVGSTGRSYGNHLHFEVHKEKWNYEKSNAVDPLVFLNEGGKQEDVLEVNKLDKSHEERVDINAGDTLWSISQVFNVTVEELKQWNNLDSNLIIAGNSLIVFKEKS
ncbi:peptidoglycan DD-metalloendopeptidase family protein [Pseudalkalibacillus berkeleyi]|uniref:Peptidoglycan DD-metalloendopeptidase family protein n=1 Tax=Pseudalkalibacillus berkeleyi TaxID=1069813 RepID=A0ABS9H1G9_9BACL|nr:peptidoglycan DD-metalloendopeptidase family protein [Pseudalkalibacillus berkeleyi]MCF6137618.1 peptidoglycan DD-metalloendopeptidase family protein [Pseudalkalibacillus berkeleyi]